jgi:tRNA(fMet)-specific endonuclease VapC
MTFLLDTNACIAILRDRDSNVARRLMREPCGTVALCSVVNAELYYGTYKNQQGAPTLAKLDRFIRIFHSYAFDDPAAEVYGRIRADLTVRGTPIRPGDLMIAAIALANNVILVAHNTREFARVDRRPLEDWT